MWLAGYGGRYAQPPLPVEGGHPLQSRNEFHPLRHAERLILAHVRNIVAITWAMASSTRLQDLYFSLSSQFFSPSFYFHLIIRIFPIKKTHLDHIHMLVSIFKT